MIFCANGVDEVDEVDKVDEVDEIDEVDEVENEAIVDVEDYLDSDLSQHIKFEQNLEQSSSNTKMAESRIENSLEDLLKEAYQDNVVNSIIDAKQQSLRKLPADLIKRGMKLAMGDLTLEGSGRGGSTRLYVKGKMYVPDNESLRLFLLQQHHDPPTQGHLGYKAMLRKMLENWYWIGMP